MPPKTKPQTNTFGAPNPAPFSFGAGFPGATPQPQPPAPVVPDAAAAAPVVPQKPQHGGLGGFDLGKFLQVLLAGGTNLLPQVNLGQQLASIRQAKDPQGEANRGYVPGAMPGQASAQYSPFANGFFNSGSRY